MFFQFLSASDSEMRVTKQFNLSEAVLVSTLVEFQSSYSFACWTKKVSMLSRC
jgi:hypothetical protein